MRLVTVWGSVFVGAGILLVTSMGVAHAAGQEGSVGCSGNACSIVATSPGHHGATGKPVTAVPVASKRSGGASGGGQMTIAPYCTGSSLFCQGVPVGYASPLLNGTIYGPAPGKGKPGLPAPAVLAAEAEKVLRLPAPSIEANPPAGEEQVVNVPTWLWIDRADWKAITGTASVPGESVTATATPLRVVWRMGDGSSVTCSGPGTPWSSGDNPSSSSPTCGHTYTVSSAVQPNGVYVVSATVEWRVVWRGGGAQGVFPDLRSTASVNMRVSEVQALVTSS